MFLTFIKLQFVIEILGFFFKKPFYTGFTVSRNLCYWLPVFEHLGENLKLVYHISVD